MFYYNPFEGMLNSSNSEATFVQKIRGKNFRKTSKPCQVGMHEIAPADRVLSDEYPYRQGFSHLSDFLHHFALANLATSSRRVNHIFSFSPCYDIPYLHCIKNLSKARNVSLSIS